MSNDLQYLNKQGYAKDMQVVFFKENVALGIANTRLEAVLPFGTQVNRPYATTPVAQTYAKDTAITPSDIDSTNEYLTVDTTKVVGFYIDEVSIGLLAYK